MEMLRRPSAKAGVLNWLSRDPLLMSSCTAEPQPQRLPWWDAINNWHHVHPSHMQNEFEVERQLVAERNRDRASKVAARRSAALQQSVNLAEMR
jgi:hypothetical protein